jgi:hypothetical protein
MSLPVMSLTASHVVLRAAGATDIRIAMQGDGWRSPIEQCLTAWRSRQGKASLKLSAQLGMHHARVAVMPVEGPRGVLEFAASTHGSLVNAWAQEMLHVDLDQYVVRWRALADPRKVLVSCVARRLAEDVQAACDSVDVSLASCRPAVLTLMDSAALPAGANQQEITVTWTEHTEGNNRYPAVQLLRFHSGRLHASWRGWIPQGEDEDAQVQSALARFESQTGGAAPKRAAVRWPV